jgi:predicted RNase H-like HicB family nuclease
VVRLWGEDGCITTAETIEEGLIMIEDAKREWIKAAIELEIEIPVSY